MNKEHKYKDKDEYKDNDKDKDAERITESLTVCYIFGILTTQAFQFWFRNLRHRCYLSLYCHGALVLRSNTFDQPGVT